MTDAALMRFEAESAPPPLAPLEHIVISPANVELEQRRQHARQMTRKEFRAAERRYNHVRQQLDRADYRGLLTVARELRPAIEQLASQRDYRLAVLGDGPEANARLLTALAVAVPDALRAQMRAHFRQRRELLSKWRVVNNELARLKPLAMEAAELKRRAQDHFLAVERGRVERAEAKRMEKEAKIYESFIIDRWTRLGYAHRYSVGNGKHKVDKVKFANVDYSLDAIYYQIDASYKTLAGGWKTNIPEGVFVVKQLLAPDTLDELTVACQRQVTGLHNTNGAWVIVHRLESADGLMNYVTYDAAMQHYPHQEHRAVPICVGVGAHRRVEWLNMAEFPHWLIGGITNSGKSNMINVLISTLISRHSPRDLRLMLIDLKGGLEFSFYEGVPHLHGNIVENIEGVEAALAELESIMRERFKRFKGVAKTLEGYHARRPHDYMPRLVCVFDEVASIMDYGDMTKRILSSLRELTRQGRAVGIHIVLCTQRPDVRAIEGSIKANLAVRISGRMPTAADSVTVLGNSAAKELAAVPGRMVLAIGPDPRPIQTPHITAEMIGEALRIAQQFAPPPALDVPESARVVHQVWNEERVIELSIKHLGGNISAKQVYENADGLSQAQARQIVERIWTMSNIEFEGKQYKVQTGRSNVRRLVEVA